MRSSPTSFLTNGKTGIELCADLLMLQPNLPVLVITGHGSMDTAISAMQAGAYDFITKPILIDSLLISLRRSISHHPLKKEVHRLRNVVESSQRLDSMIGESAAIKKVIALIDRVSASDTSILITGESGTGKELVARELHNRSGRKDAPFIAINCATSFPNTRSVASRRWR